MENEVKTDPNQTAVEVKSLRQDLDRLRDKVFWTNVLAGVMASVVFFILTQVWTAIAEMYGPSSAGFTWATVAAVLAFVGLVGINLRQTYRHTRDKKAMGTPAFILWQIALGLIGVSLVILIFFMSVPSPVGS